MATITPTGIRRETKMWTVGRLAAGVHVFLTLFTTVLSHETGGHSHDHDHDHDHHNESIATTENPANSTTAAKSMSEAYIYGTLSVIIVSFLSLAGVMVLPLIKRKMTYNSVMLVFMSLAVGTMTSDAILHLIPETLGLHGHGSEQESDHDHDHDHNHSHSHEDKPYLGKMVLILATLYGLYLLEVVARGVSDMCKNRRAVRDGSGVKSVKPASADGERIEKHEVVKIEGQNNNATAIEMWTKCDHGHGHSHTATASEDGSGSHRDKICGLPSIAFMLTISDTLHNFTDGLAIGAAFAKSSAAGLAVSIAVVCHELPHEVGDFAILLNAGLSVKKALLLNFISALTCFLGVYPGIIAGQQESLRQWVFAAVAGGFLYVALVHMLREIKDFGPLPRYLSFTLQNVGLLTGFVLVFLLAVYEDQLSAVM